MELCLFAHKCNNRSEPALSLDKFISTHTVMMLFWISETGHCCSQNEMVAKPAHRGTIHSIGAMVEMMKMWKDLPP